MHLTSTNHRSDAMKSTTTIIFFLFFSVLCVRPYTLDPAEICYSYALNTSVVAWYFTQTTSLQGYPSINVEKNDMYTVFNGVNVPGYPSSGYEAVSMWNGILRNADNIAMDGNYQARYLASYLDDLPCDYYFAFGSISSFTSYPGVGCFTGSYNYIPITLNGTGDPNSWFIWKSLNTGTVLLYPGPEYFVDGASASNWIMLQKSGTVTYNTNSIFGGTLIASQIDSDVNYGNAFYSFTVMATQSFVSSTTYNGGNTGQLYIFGNLPTGLIQPCAPPSTTISITNPQLALFGNTYEESDSFTYIPNGYHLITNAINGPVQVAIGTNYTNITEWGSQLSAVPDTPYSGIHAERYGYIRDFIRRPCQFALSILPLTYSGITITPGSYCIPRNFSNSVTFDGLGNPNATFFMKGDLGIYTNFQMYFVGKATYNSVIWSGIFLSLNDGNYGSSVNIALGGHYFFKYIRGTQATVTISGSLNGNAITFSSGVNLNIQPNSCSNITYDCSSGNCTLNCIPVPPLPSTTYTISEQTITGPEILQISNYIDVIIENSVFMNVSLSFSNITGNLVLNNTSFNGFGPSNVLINLRDVQNTYVENVSSNGPDAVIYNPNGCADGVWFMHYNSSGQVVNWSIHLDSVSLNLTNKIPVNLLGINYLNRLANETFIPSNFTAISTSNIQITYTDPMLFQSVSPNWCPYAFFVNVTENQLLYESAILYADLFGTSGGNVSIAASNSIIFEDSNSDLSQKNINSATTFTYDNTVHLRSLSSTTTVNIKTPSQSRLIAYDTWTPSLLPIPIRCGYFISNTSASSIIETHYVTLPATPSYQQEAYAILTQHTGPSFNAYVYDIQIEPDTAVFDGWNQCYWTCRRANCTQAYLSPGEFSTYQNGVCYGESVFVDETAFADCNPRNLSIVPGYSNSKAIFFSSKNRIDHVLSISSSGPVIITQTTTNLASSRYGAILDPTITDLTIISNPFMLLVPFAPNRTSSLEYLQNLEFTNINFNIIDFAMFSTCISTQSTAYGLIPPSFKFGTLSFQSLTLNGYNGFAFQLGLYLINNNPSTGYASLFNEIENFLLNDVIYSGFDVLTPSPFVFDSIFITNSNLSHIQNSFAYTLSNLTSFTLENTAIWDSYSSQANPLFISARGTGQTGSIAIVSNVNTYSLSTRVPYPGTTTIFASISLFENMTFQSNQLNTGFSVGLDFENITNFACSYQHFIVLRDTNPGFNGYVEDFSCNFISCQGDPCGLDPTLPPPTYCIVDPNYPVTGQDYRYVYFHTMTDFSVNCRATYPKHGLITSNTFSEQSLVFKTSNENDTLLLEPYDYNAPIPYIVGSTQTFSLAPSSNIILKNILFWNPTGLSAYTPSLAQWTLSTIDGNLINFTAINVTFLAYQPVIPYPNFQITADHSQNTAYANALIQGINQTSSPTIYSPGVVGALLLAMNGNLTLSFVTVYGAAAYGIRVFKLKDGTTDSVTDVIGANTWGGFLSLPTSYDLTLTDIQCQQFCGGLSSYGIAFSVVEVGFTTGRRLSTHNLNITALETIYNHPTITVRFPYGNPYVSLSGSQLGHLTAYYMYGMNGAGWVEYTASRGSYLLGLPVGIRANPTNVTILDLNNVQIYRNDQNALPRQLVYENSHITPTQYIKGVFHDSIIGAPSQDPTLISTQYCDAMCPISTAGKWCYVSVAYTTPDYEYWTDLNAAAAGCPYYAIMIMDSVYTININTDFGSSNRDPGSNMTVLGYRPGTVIVGHHQIQQNCISGNVYPISVNFQNIQFQADLDWSGIILEHVTTPSCNIESSVSVLNITTCSFTTNSSSTVLPSRAYSCTQCYASGLNMVTSSVLIPTTDTAVVLNSTNSQANAVITAFSMSNCTSVAILLVNVASFDIQYPVIHCETGPTAVKYPLLGDISIIGSQSITGVHRIQFADVQANNGNVTNLLNGIFWDLGQALTFDQISVVAQNITASTGSASEFGIAFQVPNIDQYYPCSPGSDAYINMITNNNTGIQGRLGVVGILDSNGIILGYILTNAQNMSCFASALQTQDNWTLTAGYILFGSFFSFIVLWIIAFPLGGFQFFGDQIYYVLANQHPTDQQWVDFRQKNDEWDKANLQDQ